MESVTEILGKLQKRDLDLFERNRHLQEIASRGAAVVRELLPLVPTDPSVVDRMLRAALQAIADSSDRDSLHDELEHQIAPKNDPRLREVCIDLLADHYPEATHVGQRLLDFTANRNQETRQIRICALRAAIRLKPAAAIGGRLLTLLQDDDLEIVRKALGALPAYRSILPAEHVAQELERLIGPSAELEVRCTAIDLLGLFGEIDVLERVCLLPLKHEREQFAVQAMVRRLLDRPRSVIQLNPKNFEHLVGRLLEKMGYESVAVQPKSSWDQGVDLTAYYHEERLKGRERFKMICQCKRYRRSNLVGSEVVSLMIASLKEEKAGRGVIITTSDFLPAARELARSHQHIELICGAELQDLLDRHFARELYRVLR